MSQIAGGHSWFGRSRVLILLAVLALVFAAWNWDLGSGSWRSVCALSFSPDGQTLAAGLYDGKVFNKDFHNFVGDFGRAVVLFDVDSGRRPSVLDCKRLDGVTD